MLQLPAAIRKYLSAVPEETTVILPAGLTLESWITVYVESGLEAQAYAERLAMRHQELEDLSNGVWS